MDKTAIVNCTKCGAKLKPTYICLKCDIEPLLVNENSHPLEAVVKPANDVERHRTDIVLVALRELEGWLLNEKEMDAKTINKVTSRILKMKKERENRLLV